MKVSDGFTQMWPSVGVIAMFCVGAISWSRERYGPRVVDGWIIGLGIEAVVSVVLGMLLFSEKFSSFQIAGIVLIVGGTVLTELA